MSNFEFPTNIRQIGSINEGLRIYVEDYVCSYLQQYAQSGGYNEKLAILIGRYLTIDTQPVLFISGAIQGKYCVEENGIMVFSDKSHEYIDEQMEKYFPALEIVGWMQSQPSYGTYLNSSYHNYHIDNFKKAFQVLFIIDPIERLNAFYIFDEKEEELKESRGYFIYYEKNRNMHEYMLDNKVVKDKEETNEDPYDDSYDDFSEEEDIKIPIAFTPRNQSERPRRESAYRSPPQKRYSESEARKRQPVRTRKATGEQKRTVNMLVSLCGVLFLICFIMGAGLLRSEEKIAVLEENLLALNTAYRNMVNNQTSTQNVFAPQSDQGEIEEPVAGVVLSEDGNQLLESDAELNNVLTGDLSLSTTHPVVVEAVPSTNQAPPPDASAQPENSTSDAYTDIPDTYTVKEGDNLLTISQRFYGTNQMVNKIMEINNLSDPDKIYFGKVLVLPK